MKYAISSCYIFQGGFFWFMDNLLCLCDVWKCASDVNANISVSSIFSSGQFHLKYYFLRHRSSLLKEIQLSVNCYVSILNFHQSTKTTTVFYIYNILEECCKALLKIDALLPRASILNLSYEWIFIALFSILFHQMCTWDTKELAHL